MGRFGGDYTVDGGEVYDESRGILTGFQQQSAPIVDVMLNTALYAQMTVMRRLIQSTFRAGTPFGAFAITQATNNDPLNWKVAGAIDDSIWGSAGLSDAVDAKGDGSQDTQIPEGPARFFVGGLMAMLPNSREWGSADPANEADVVLGEPPIHSTITALSSDTITDSSAFFGELGDALTTSYNSKEIKVAPNIDDRSGGSSLTKYYNVSAATSSTLTLDTSKYYTYDTASGTLSSSVAESGFGGLSDVTSVGKQYRLLFPWDSTDRCDSLYLDVYIDEMDSTDDKIVKRPIGGAPVESANLGVVRQRIDWVPNYNGGTTTVASTAPGYNLYEKRTDSDGNVHHRVLMSVLNVNSTDLVDADITQYNNDPLYGLTLGGLPETSTDTAIVDGTADTNSIGVETAPGEFGDSLNQSPPTAGQLHLDKLLFQMLGNVTDDMNKALQNMGDYTDSGGEKKGNAGGAEAARTALTSDGHILLGTNQEQGAIIGRHANDDPNYNNLFMTKDSHLGRPLNSDGTETDGVGELAYHAKESSWLSSGTDVAGAADFGISGEGNTNVQSSGETGVGALLSLNSEGNVSAPPAPIICSVFSFDKDMSSNWSENSWFSTGIDCTGYGNAIADLEAEYMLFAIPFSRCSNRGGHFGHGANNWKIANNVLQVRFDIHQGSDETEEMHMGMAVFGIARATTS